MKEENKEVSLWGIPVSMGIISGNTRIVEYVFQKKGKSYKIKEFEIPREVGRIKEALQVLLLVNEYSEKFLLQYFGPPVVEIFEFQKMFLEDKRFINETLEIIETKKYRAETAVRMTLDKLKHALLESESKYLRERISDINDLKKSFMDALMNPIALFDEKKFKPKKGSQGKKPTVVIMKELIPRLVIEQKMEGTGAIITEQGGKTSHAAILCRAFGIPAVTGIKNIHSSVPGGSKILVNGNSGEVIINPLKATIQQTQAIKKQNSIIKPTQSIKNTNNSLQILSNINFATEVTDVKQSFADGIGLYRTEFEFMAAGRFLDEDEQFIRYKSVIKAMNGLPVHIRLLDLGRDKEVTDHHFSGEHFIKTKSFGAQFLLENVDVLAMQAKAIARASRYGPVSVVYPMISELQQFIDLKKLFYRTTAGISCGSIKHGIMLEVPSACFAADRILKAADFGSIGTNDLISLLFGIKRDDNKNGAKQAAKHPLLWKLLTNISHAAQKHDKPLLLCGELAKDYSFIEKITKLAIESISVSPKFVSPIRNWVNSDYQSMEVLQKQHKAEKKHMTV
jgi:phosphotransferase system enzyme I (PtsI)